jgi:quercetin dioxygenase-like cupin family protein
VADPLAKEDLGITTVERITVIYLIRFVVTLFLCGLASGQQNSPVAVHAQQSKLTLDKCVNQFDLAHVESTKVGYQYWFVDKKFLDGRTLKMSVVAPHSATHRPHRHPEDEFFFVLEGKAEFYLNGETRAAEPYASFYCPPNSEHGIRNVGDTILKYLVIKKYPKK